jgi:hypothetical protein
MCGLFFSDNIKANPLLTGEAMIHSHTATLWTRWVLLP